MQHYHNRLLAMVAQHLVHPLFVGEVIGSNLSPTPRQKQSLNTLEMVPTAAMSYERHKQ